MTAALVALLAAQLGAGGTLRAPPDPPAVPDSPEPVRRFTLVAAANDGGRARPRLRYAVADAKRFSAVLQELGGVAAEDAVLVVEPNAAALGAAFGAMRARVRAAGDASRVELVFYYSGHSDEVGLLLGNTVVPYPELRRWIEELGADVRVAVLDSCSSGALTRAKGGIRAPSFLLDGSTRVSGHAILTSSAEDEASQESDRIEASFFTHALVTGLRGAADASGDGRVTLSEVYQFAFQETLARTERTRGGAQHPSYDMELVGSGDLVLTDLRGAGSRLVFPDAIAGKLFVRDGGERLVAELRKFPGRTMELSLAPGEYRVVLADGAALTTAKVALAAGGRTELLPAALVTAKRELTAMRGDGTDFAFVPIDVSIFPPLSFNGDRLTVNRFQVGIIASRTTRLRGVGVAPVLWADDDVVGAQLGWVGNSARGPVTGVQLASGANVAGALVGAQLASGLGIVRGDAIGVQGAAVVWTTGRLTGVQGAYGFAFSRAVKGAQLATVAIAREVRGLQLGLVPLSEDLAGAQLGLVNIGGSVDGLQLGLVNFARRSKGFQVGLVNVVSGASDGSSVGILNFVRGGEQRLTLLGDVDGGARWELLLGSRRFHSILGARLQRTENGERWWGAFGLGARLGGRGRLFVDLDLLGEHVKAVETPHLDATLRALAGWRLASRAAIVAGPTANLMLSFDEAFAPGAGGLGRDVAWFGAEHGRASAGFVAGLRM
jgi:hypothetical protein